jgi:CRP-like cAMP-binding protein
MLDIADSLAVLPFLTRVPRDHLDRAASRFDRVSLLGGEPLWQEGAPSGSLAVVVSGELEVRAKGRAIAVVKAREIVGEASAFFTDKPRTASVAANRATEVLVLGSDDLRALRWQKSRVYDALLDAALQTLCRRILATNTRIGEMAAGSVASPERKEPGALARLWRTFRPGGPTGPCPPIGPLLRTLPGLRDIEPEVEAELAEAYTAEPLEDGQLVVLEGEYGFSGYIVAEGSVAVLRNVRGDKAELLAKLGPGQQFGMNTLVNSMPRTASCVAESPGWLYRMDGQAWERLRGDARRAWRESVLATLSGQITSANAALDRAMRDHAKRGGLVVKTRGGPTDPFKELLAASGYLEALPIGDEGLEAVQFVVDEDMKRNPKNRGR